MKSQSVLIINQEEAIRESLHILFTEEGFQCFSASNEISAMEILNTKPVDLVVVDIQCSSMVGILRDTKNTHPKIKVLVISSYAEAEATQKALAHGADKYVLKPLDFDELIAQVQKLLLPATG